MHHLKTYKLIYKRTYTNIERATRPAQLPDSHIHDGRTDLHMILCIKYIYIHIFWLVISHRYSTCGLLVPFHTFFSGLLVVTSKKHQKPSLKKKWLFGPTLGGGMSSASFAVPLLFTPHQQFFTGFFCRPNHHIVEELLQHRRHRSRRDCS